METISDREPSVIDQLRVLGLPEGQVMVMGSGILGALGIREARDIDMVVSEGVYEYLRHLGWQERPFKSGDIEQVGLENGVFQVFKDWVDDDGIRKNLDALLVSADVVDGIAYNSLQKLVAYKIRRGQDKDIRDLKLIDEHLQTQGRDD